MNLVKNTGTYALWFGKAFRAAMRAKPGVTIGLVVCRILHLFMRVLARLLPLKAILLAGSDGVPSFFEPFLAPDQKNLGLIVLAIASIVAYAATFALEAAINTLTRSGSRGIVADANEIVLSDQLEIAESHYGRIATVVACVIFAGLGVLILAIANPLVLYAFVGAIAVVYAVAALALAIGDPHKTGSVAHFISTQFSLYLNVASVLTFIACFLVLLWPFVFGGDANVLLAMVAVMLLRRILGALTTTVKMSYVLATKAPQVNQLFFRSHKAEAPERADWRFLRDAYRAETRTETLKKRLPQVFPGNAQIETMWMDPLSGIQREWIRMKGRDGDTLAFVERIFPPAARHRLDSEAYLFEHVLPEDIGAPRPVGDYDQGPFLSQVVNCGHEVEFAEAAEWPSVHRKVLNRLWGVAPPKRLIEAHRLTHRLLPERLTNDLVLRSALAADSAESQAVFDVFQANLPQIRGRLEQLPLVISNPEIQRGNVVLGPRQPPLVLDWGRWTIEPLGAVNRLSESDLAAVLDQIPASRPDIKLRPEIGDVLLASRCARLETCLLRGQYRTALEMMSSIIAESGNETDLYPQEELEEELTES